MTGSRPRAQLGALPYRRAPGLEILLVTSRETGRWVIPKGWPMKSRTRREAAALEALEEAGVEGRISKKPIGAFDYLKVLRSGAGQPCRVSVFSFEVTLQRDSWREQSQRSTQWFAWEAAAAAVVEPGLASLIREFAQAGPDADESPPIA
jgi:8-oxo-dGTP pyrophosphatase MutT (NUDIX family)